MAFRNSANSGKRAAQIFSASTKDDKKNEDAPNFFLKLFYGQYSLVKSFWLFLVSIPLLADILFSHLLFPLLDVTREKDTLALFVWVFCIAAFSILASIGVWRSAGRYQGSSLWRVLARVAASLGLCGAVGYMVLWYGIWHLLRHS